MHVFLLTRAGLEKQFLRPEVFLEVEESVEEIGICPVVELLELCEAIRKAKLKLDINQLRSGIQKFKDSPVNRQEIFVVSLDQERLFDALFEREGENVIELWPPAANRSVSPAHTIRRLLLRPSDRTWWDGDIYAEAEAIYGIGETNTNV